MKIKHLLCFVLLLFLVGCSFGNSKIIQQDFKQGVRSLGVELLDNAPPKEIRENTNFLIVADLINEEAYDISGELNIVGLDEKYFVVTPGQQEFSMVGKSLTNPAGDRIFLEFDGLSRDLFQNSEKYLGDFFLKANYETSLEFSDTVCINPSFYDVYSSGCVVKEKQSYSGQGGSLAVNGVEEVIIPNKGIEFRISLKNKGKGEVGTVKLLEANLGNQLLDCTFKGAGFEKTELEFEEDELLVCETFLQDLRSYETLLSLKFAYDYTIKEKKRLTLVR